MEPVSSLTLALYGLATGAIYTLRAYTRRCHSAQEMECLALRLQRAGKPDPADSFVMH